MGLADALMVAPDEQFSLEQAVRRQIDNAPCIKCGLGREAGAHMVTNFKPTCKFRLDRGALARAIVAALLDLAPASPPRRPAGPATEGP